MAATVIEPLRQEWARVQATAERLKEERQATEEPRQSGMKMPLISSGSLIPSFAIPRCSIPLAVRGTSSTSSLEHLKKLEGEVLEALLEVGGQESTSLGSIRQTVGPHQFLGLELNPRAAAIAELVIWLGYLQWHFRTKGKSAA